MDAAYGNERTAAQVSDELRTRLAEVERERDTLTRQVKVLREALEGTDRYDMVLEKHLGQPHIMSKKSVDGAWVLYHEALAALTSEGAER